MKTMLNYFTFDDFGFCPFFEADGGTSGDGSNAEDTSGNNEEQGNGDSEEKKEDNNFLTQERVNALIGAAKAKAKKSALKELFEVESDEELEANLKEFNALKEKKKTDNQKNNENIEKLKKAEYRANIAERKLEVIKAGILPEFVDDFVIIAMSKVNSENTFEEVVESLKSKYPSMLVGNDNADNGTGSANNPRRRELDNNEKGSIGERLAKSKKASLNQDSDYFKI